MKLMIDDKILKGLVDYVNNGWSMNYTVEDVACLEWGEKFLYIHFNKVNKDDNRNGTYPVVFLNY